MGLDSHWHMPQEPRAGADAACHPVFDPPLRLSPTGDDRGRLAFRGKAYAGVIRTYTGYDLYHYLDAAAVRGVADALDRLPAALADFPDLADVRRMFRVYADAGAALVADC